MTATPAQVANDPALQAEYFVKRDDKLASACRTCARLIRAYLADEKVDRLTYTDGHVQMLNAYSRYCKTLDTQIAKSVARGLHTLQTLNGDRHPAVR